MKNMITCSERLEDVNNSTAISPKHINVLLDTDTEFGTMASKYYNMTGSQRGEFKKALKERGVYKKLRPLFKAWIKP